MDFQTLVGTAELIGAAVVVISLIYVAVQIRQNTNMAAGTAQRELMTSFQEQLDRIVTYAELFRAGAHSFDDLSGTDQLKFQLIFNQFINHLEKVLRMRDRGLETDDNVKIYGDICLTFLQSEGGRRVWEATSDLYFERSREYLIARLGDPSSLPPPLGSRMDWWKSDPQ